MLDIDHFKDVNDEYGHVTGDEVLQDLADLLENESREVDIVCRYGGEEFTIIPPATSCRKAEKMAERLRKSIRNHDFGIDRQITVSGGVTEYLPSQSENDSDIIRTVDQRLYLAKSGGRNQIVASSQE